MKEIIEKVKEGSALTDKELDKAISHYDTLADALQVHGEICWLTWRYIYGELIRLEGFKSARNNK
jgi:hypothetical protein